MKKRKKGSALVFTFLILTMLLGFVISMQEVAVSTAKVTESSEIDGEAESVAEVGINYFIYRVLQRETTLDLGNNPEQAYQDLMQGSGGLIYEFMQQPTQSGNLWTDNGEKWYPFGPDGARFRLRELEVLGNYSYRLVVEGQVPYEGDYHTARIEGVIGAFYDKAGSYGFTSVTTPHVKGNNNELHSYGEPGKQVVYNAPGKGNFSEIGQNITFNDNTGLVESRMKTLIEEAQKRADSVADLIRNVTLTPRTSPTALGDTYDFGAGKLDYSKGRGSWKRCGSSKCDDWHWYPSGTVKRMIYTKNDKHFVFGRPDQWSVMKFDVLVINGNKNTLRLYPGVYYFHDFRILGNDNKIYLDTTTGPVYIVVRTGQYLYRSGWRWRGDYGRFEIHGNNNSLVVFKDLDYSGSDLAGKDVNPLNLPDYYTDYSNKVDAQGDFKTVGPTGRKLAEVFVGGHTGDIDFYIDGNNNLIGAFAVGNGGGITNPLQVPVIEDDEEDAKEVGSDVKDEGSKLQLLPDFQASPASPTSEQFRVWGRGYAEINLKGNNCELVGGYLFVNCMNHVHEFMIQGDNNRIYGAVSIEGRFTIGRVNGSNVEWWGTTWTTNANNNIVYLDNRFYPFPPSPHKKTMHLKYKRRLK